MREKNKAALREKLDAMKEGDVLHVCTSRGFTEENRTKRSLSALVAHADNRARERGLHIVMSGNLVIAIKSEKRDPIIYIG